MSLKRRALKLAGVKRFTSRLVITATVTEYPDDKDGNKVKPDVHLNLDNPNGLGLMDARAILQKVLADVQLKIDVEDGHGRHLGAEMLDGTNVVAPGPLKRSSADGPATQPAAVS